MVHPIMMDRNLSGQSPLERFHCELSRKRKALDKEIEKFMAVKDAEFKKFEKELKSQWDGFKYETYKTNTDEGNPTIVSRGFTVGPFPRASTLEDVIQIDTEISTEVQLPNNTHPSAAVAVENDVSKQNTGQRSPLRRTSSREERESELVSFFAPAYLPSLDGPKGHGKAISADESSRISTSLTTLGNITDDEWPNMPDCHSSSSPTGTSQRLKKSSMRRPDSSDLNRERKHVLFAIDRQLMSPGASPVDTRSTSGMNAPIPSLGIQDIPANDTDLIGSSRASALVAALSLSRSPFQSPAASSRSYKDLVEPTVIPSPDAADPEDLQSFVKDPLFDSGELQPPLDDDEWELSEVQSRSEEEESITRISHIGSVPIQIQQSARR